MCANLYGARPKMIAASHAAAEERVKSRTSRYANHIDVTNAAPNSRLCVSPGLTPSQMKGEPNAATISMASENASVAVTGWKILASNKCRGSSGN